MLKTNRMIEGGNTLQAVVTVEDPGAFNMPWTTVQRWRRANREMPEDICAENNVDFLRYSVVPIPQLRIRISDRLRPPILQSGNRRRSMTTSSLGALHRRTVAAASCFALAAAISLTSLAYGQDQSAATPKDTIFARKILMGSVDGNFNELQNMTGSGRPMDVGDAREHFDHISVLLLAFPHMFPPATNQWTQGTARDPAFDTFAAPEIWISFADFYKRANEAADIALKASRATTEAELRARIRELDRACDGCHDKYQKNQDSSP